MVQFSIFQKIEDSYEKIKADVQAKEVISKEDIQKLLIKPSMEYSHYTDFVRKFVITMEEFKKCNLALDVKKSHIFNSREEKILIQHADWSNHFQENGG